MTTDKTPATLATAKHGGCVQLGDAPFAWSERAKSNALEAGQFAFTEADGNDLGYTACIEACVDAICSVLALPEHRAALSAQPSPGSQADALVDTARRNIRQFISKASFSSSVDKQAALSCVDVLEEALAARQPVGEPVAYKFQDRTADGCWTDQYWHKLPPWEHRNPIPLYAAPPAQAVDLGRFRKLASWVANCAGHGINDSQRRLGEELLALLDSQAVGNGQPELPA